MATDATMERAPVRVLLVDDDEDALILTESLLHKDPLSRYALAWVQAPDAARAALIEGDYDVCLLDYRLGPVNGLELLDSLQGQLPPDRPIILLTGWTDEQTTVDALARGAADFLRKDRLDAFSLQQTIRYSMERARILSELQQTKTRYDLAVAGVRDGIWDWDLRADEVFYSEHWMEAVGLQPGGVPAAIETWLGRVHPDDQESVREALDAHIEGRSEQLKVEYRLRHADGSYRWMQNRGHAERDAAGRAVRIAGSQSDITEDKLLRERLAHRALHDDLTGLPNRALFGDRVEHALQRARRDKGRIIAVLFLDLDRFKVINDSLGHPAGDGLLVEVARRLTHCLRPGDSVARLGGDEFAVLVDDAGAESNVLRVVGRIRETLAEPFLLGGREVFTAASVGVAFGQEEHAEASDLLRDADAAMYRAKRAGRGGHAVSSSPSHAQAMSHLELETELRRGVARGEFELFFQPIVAIDSSAIVGLEGLMRWHHPTRGLLSPAEFLGLADEIGLLPEMERTALAAAGGHLQRWSSAAAQRGGSLAVSVNFCGRNLRASDLHAQLLGFLGAAELAPEAFKLELTEDTFMRRDDAIQRNLMQLRESRISVYIDDFGTGYSSFGRLREMAVDRLKIDRSFITRIHLDEGSREIVRAIVTLARNLGLEVIAEGAETDAQVDTLRELQCEYCQGFFYSPPLRPADVDVIFAQGALPRH